MDIEDLLLEEARKEARKEVQKEHTLKMKQYGIDINIIVNVTGFSIDEIGKM